MKISTKDYINNQIAWLKAYTDAEIKAVRQAVDKVETTNANYRETQNEWRGQIKDAALQFITRKEVWIGAVAIITILIALYFKK